VESDFLDSQSIGGPKFDYNSATYSSLENLSSVSNPRNDDIENNSFLDRRRTAGGNGAGSSTGSAVSASILLTTAASGGNYRSTTTKNGRNFSLEEECQTDKLSEMCAIRKILEDDEISQLISQKFLTEFRVLMRSKLK
uniref:Uncharacterized protein n=1 Tax=Romanomermis culicivorax TaxID=13658 RepID=A0A915HD91_ROMCU